MTKRVAVVTGAFGALGRVMVEHLYAQDYAVAALDLAQASPTDLSGGVLALGGTDMSDPGSAAQAFEAVATRLGRPDVLVNIAGGFTWETLAEGDIGAWERLYTLNVKTAVVGCKTALPYLRQSRAGRIVNIGAASALKATAGLGAYTASKSAVMRLTESLADELKGSTVTVNAVLPSIIDTPTNRNDMPNADPAKWVSPSELAHTIGFLVSEQASAVTGALIPVTGSV